VQLQDPAQYAIDARSTVGEVYSDYDGKYRTRLRMGDGFLAAATAAATGPAHRVFLRVKIGDIDIVKMGVNPIAGPQASAIGR